MQHLLLLNTALQSLTTNEFFSWIQSYSPKQISSFIFQSIRTQIQNAENTSEIQNIVSLTQRLNNTAKEIINLRSKCNQIKTTSSTFNKLSYTTISTISSFLDFTSIINFEKCAKSVYIGTRSPLSLYEIDEDYFGKCVRYSHVSRSIYHCHRFQNVSTLYLQVKDLYEQPEGEDCGNGCQSLTKYGTVALKDIPIWRNLKQISVSYIYGWWGDYGIHEFESDLQQCNATNIQTLRVTCSVVEHDKLLKLFPNLRFFDLDDDETDSEIFEDCVLPSDLHGLTLNIANNIRFRQWRNVEFLKMNQLQSLHIMSFEETMVNKCLGLKEICLKLCKAKDIQVFVSQNLTRLERVYVDLSDMAETSVDLFEESLAILFRFDTINYIKTKFSHLTALQLIINLLSNHYRTMGYYKERIKIHIVCTKKPIKCDVVQLMLGLVSALNQCSKEFMLICEFKINKVYQEVNKEIMRSNQFIFNGDYNDKTKIYKFAISNKACKIEGYREKWIMTCRYCK